MATLKITSKKKPTKKPDLKVVTTHAKHSFTDIEIKELALDASRRNGEIVELEGALSSIKSDYKSKIEAAANSRDTAFNKITSGFEMREVQAVVEFNSKSKKKRFYLYDDKKKHNKGEFFREEDMTPADLQRDMFEQIPVAKREEPLNPVIEPSQAEEVSHAISE